MVCLACILIPFALIVWLKYVNPYLQRRIDEWKAQDRLEILVDTRNAQKNELKNVNPYLQGRIDEWNAKDRLEILIDARIAQINELKYNNPYLQRCVDEGNAQDQLEILIDTRNAQRNEKVSQKSNILENTKQNINDENDNDYNQNKQELPPVTTVELTTVTNEVADDDDSEIFYDTTEDCNVKENKQIDIGVLTEIVHKESIVSDQLSETEETSGFIE